MLTLAGIRRITVALPPRAPDTCDTSVSGLVAGALTSTAMLRARPSWPPRARSTIPSTPAIPSSACAPTVSRVLLAAVTGYQLPLTRPAVRPAATVVIRSPAAKSDQTCESPAVAGGVHGRSADASAASTVSCAPLTVIFAPSMASTDPDAAQRAQPPQVRRGHAARHRGDDVGHDQAGGGGPGEGGVRLGARPRPHYR